MIRHCDRYYYKGSVYASRDALAAALRVEALPQRLRAMGVARSAEQGAKSQDRGRAPSWAVAGDQPVGVDALLRRRACWFSLGLEIETSDAGY